MKPETLNINARYYLAPSRAPMADETAFDVIDRALEYNHRPAVVFSNGTEEECREWVERNYETPSFEDSCFFLITTAPKLLALLEQYHSAMPTKESGALIAEAKGWVIE